MSAILLDGVVRRMVFSDTAKTTMTNCYAHVVALLSLIRPHAVAKYYNERVCVCLSVREHISRTTRAIFTKFFNACCLSSWLDPLPAG